MRHRIYFAGGKGGKFMREQLRQFRLGVIGAMSVACILATAPVSNAAQTTAPVATTTGTYQGLMNFQEQPGDPTSGVNAFLGIRYGQAPINTLRWKPPQVPNPGQGSIVAGTFGNTCPQGRATDSEDCLFLNVYTPSNANQRSKLPVFIWIHGGALTNGAGSDYDPSVMVADNDIIVVTINYRLKSLGFLAASVLAATEANAFQNVGDAGNYGFMDQQFAMQWVQENIAAFGGDPGAVTIGGESAGGLSVSSHLASTNSFRHLTGRDLFAGAIIESGGYMYHDVPSLATYQTLSNTFVQKDASTLCPNGTVTLTCLQGLTPTQLFTNESLFGGFGIAPNFGTKILPLDLHTAFSTGQFNQVPVLQGTNANEGRLFETDFFPGAVTAPSGTGATIFAAGGPASFDLQVPNVLCGTPQFDPKGTPATCSYLQEIQFFLATLVTAAPSTQGPTSPFTEAIVAAATTAESEYPITNFHNFVPQPSSPLSNNFGGGNVDEALSQIFTDFVFACNGFDSNSDLSRRVQVFAYEFNDPNAPSTAGVPGPGSNSSGFTTASEHASELQYIFNFGSAFTPAQAALAADMKTYWANFVKTGDPNSRGSDSKGFATFVNFRAPHAQLPFWPQFNDQGNGRGDQKIQSLTPAGAATPQGPHPFDTFTSEHFCSTWQPLLTFNNGNEPQQP
jgi:para-nitrobenzyl esterase